MGVFEMASSATQKPFMVDSSLTSAFTALSQDVKEEANEDVGTSCMKAVVVGGGTGAPVSIRSLLSLGVQTSAVVAMADDGGSTGILRKSAGVTPPGDIRKCMVAFAADPYDPLVKAFKYRLNIADGHALGNLMLATLEDACGSFPQAIDICEGLLRAQGHVYPSTLDHVFLEATTEDGRLIEGQALACHAATALREVRLKSGSDEIAPYPLAIEALNEADFIIFGPGSLFTSIIPNLLVPGIVDAVASSNATTIFICSVADVQGETWGLSAKEHVSALLSHGLKGLLDYVLLAAPPTSVHPDVRPVVVNTSEIEAIQAMGPMVVVRDLVDPEHPSWHNPSSLRDSLLHIMKLAKAKAGMEI